MQLIFSVDFMIVIRDTGEKLKIGADVKSPKRPSPSQKHPLWTKEKAFGSLETFDLVVFVFLVIPINPGIDFRNIWARDFGIILASRDSNPTGRGLLWR